MGFIFVQENPGEVNQGEQGEAVRKLTIRAKCLSSAQESESPKLK